MAGPNHTEGDVRKALAGTAGRVIRECIMAAMADYRDQYTPMQRLIHRPRTRAGIIYDHATARLTERLAEIPGAVLVNVRGLVVLVLNDEFVIKVPKKLNKRKLSRTYPTEQTLAFMGQDQATFEFLTSRTGLVIGYVLDVLAASISEVWVTCPDGMKSNAFAFELLVPAAAGTVAPAAPVDAAAGDLPFTVEKKEPGEKEGGK